MAARSSGWASARTVLLDKTGTITLGHPKLDRVISLNGMPEDEILRLAASLDRFSAHPLAAALVEGAEQQGLRLSLPEQVQESFGHGIEGARGGQARRARQRTLAALTRDRSRVADRARHRRRHGC